MPTRTPWRTIALAALAGVQLSADGSDGTRRPIDVPRATLPVVRTHAYRMFGHIRPLLAFWISRDDVGSGQLAWRRGEDGTRGWDFVLGTDPARAPRRLNRWGYIAEEAGDGRGVVFAMMSSEEESSLREVNANADQGATGGGEFKAVLAHTAAGVARARVKRIRTPRALTIGDVDTLVALADVDLRQAELTTIDLPPGTRPGFLAAVAELVDWSVLAHQRGDAAAQRPSRAVPYVFGDKLYDLTLTSTRRLDEFRDDDRRYTDMVRGKFEIRTRATGDRTRFELVYGCTGDLAGVPVLITFQPRWWLKVELHLDED